MRDDLKYFVASFFLVVSSTVAAQPVAIKAALIESMSGFFANTGEAVCRNLVWATERVNARGGVKLSSVARPLLIERYDSKGQNDDALSALRSVTQLVVGALAKSTEEAGSIEAGAVAAQMQRVVAALAGQTEARRASHHPFQGSLLVAQTGKPGESGVKFDVEGSGSGFRVVKTIASDKAAVPTSCKITRP